MDEKRSSFSKEVVIQDYWWSGFEAYFGHGYALLSQDMLGFKAFDEHLYNAILANGVHSILMIPIIVEGVETKEQKDFLIDLGCRYIQGYYFYHPMTTAEFEKLIADPEKIDTSGISFKANQQFRLRELLDNNIYSDTMLNNILGPCALYSWHGDEVDIVRYNEQFYEAVDVPDLSQRLNDIRRFMPKTDVPRMIQLLHLAKQDRLNGSTGILHF
jgi:hypothetical protein